jgi:uncharacterized membrane protein
MFEKKTSVVLILNSLILSTWLAIFFGRQLSAVSQAVLKDERSNTLQQTVNRDPAIDTLERTQSQTLPSFTTLELCNRTSNPIYTAYVNGAIDRGWNSHGWLKVQGKKCRIIDLGSYTYDFIYVYAQSGQTSWGSNDAYFCINKKKNFDFPNSNEMNCNSSKLKRVGMIKQSVQPGQNTYNFNP